MACKKFNLTELQKIRESWQDIPVEAVPESKRKVFSDRKNAVNMYIDKVTLEVSPYDISTVEAYDEDGTYIGTLKARGEFGTKSHSLKTRKQARQYARERGREKAEFDTPITALTQHLDEQAKTSKRAATRGDIVRREMGKAEPSKQENRKVTVTPMEIGRTFNDKADISNMPTNEELEHMTQKELIERLYGRA